MLACVFDDRHDRIIPAPTQQRNKKPIDIRSKGT